MYVQDNDEYFPASLTWVDEIGSYVSDKDDIFSCPSDRDTISPTSYAINSNLTNQGFSGISHPSIFPVFFDRNTTGASSSYFAGCPPSAPNDPADPFYYVFCSDRHSGGTNFLFLDGRAAWVSKPANAGIDVLNFDTR